MLKAQTQEEYCFTVIDMKPRGCYTKAKWIILDGALRQAVKLLLISAWKRELRAERKNNLAWNLMVLPGRALAVRKGIVTLWIIGAFLITYALFNHTLQVFAHTMGNANPCVLSPDRACWLSQRQVFFKEAVYPWNSEDHQISAIYRQAYAGILIPRPGVLASPRGIPHPGELKPPGALGNRLIQEADVFDMQAVKAGSPEMNRSPEANPVATIERKTRDAQLTICVTRLSDSVLVDGDDFKVAEGEAAVTWEVELIAYNMRASTGWRYWNVALEFGPELSVEAVDSPGVINPLPRGGSPSEPTLTIKRDEITRKTKVTWSWHSLDNDTSSDFPKRAKAGLRLGVYSSPESGYELGSSIFCDNAKITYMTGAKRPKETTYELSPIVVNVTSL